MTKQSKSFVCGGCGGKGRVPNPNWKPKKLINKTGEHDMVSTYKIEEIGRLMSDYRRREGLSTLAMAEKLGKKADRQRIREIENCLESDYFNQQEDRTYFGHRIGMRIDVYARWTLRLGEMGAFNGKGPRS